MKLGFFTLTISSVFLLLLTSSCLSLNFIRTPSSDPSDNFTNDAYEQAQTRNFGKGKISDAQVAHELAGRSIWFKSAPNERHHAYVFPQKVGVAIDWNQAFASVMHNSRFQTWGLINDPDCCIPGINCDQKNMRFNGRAVTTLDTFGWEYCNGDEALLDAVRNGSSYRDPACDDPVIKAADALDSKLRESRCELQFGTSTGAIGYRKFPNPRFNAKRWELIGGWQGYSEKMIREGINNSIQPPFRIGKACASCHAAFDPLNPPQDTNNPMWSSIKGETGNQYLNISKLMANGMKEDSIEAQLFTHTRPGVVDTSAVPHDFINNPGTMNAIINLPARPLFDETVSRWDPVSNCNVADVKNCQKVQYRDENGKVSYRFWAWSKRQMKVPHILKGGEDSVGYDLAVQRVYLNTGMCAEQCWMNHLTNLREIDQSARGFSQSPFDIGQCRQQCASFRANEDRVGDIFSYLSSRRPTDLKVALQNTKTLPESTNKAVADAGFKEFLENRYGAGTVERGRKIFAANCAQCHSSQNFNSKENLSPNENNFENTNFSALKTLESGEIIRADWMGNDKSTPLGEVRTYKCRALHSNHTKGHVWQDLSSDSYKNLPAVAVDNFENKVSGGPGYYRNVSLLNVWAHAPFMHNNSVGPEICGSVDVSRQVVKTSVEGRQLDANKKYTCDMHYDPSVKGRLELYDKSIDELLTPSAQRRKKITRIDVPIRFPLGLKDRYIEFPAGIPLNTIANLDIKAFLYDFTFVSSILDTSGEDIFWKYWNTKFAGHPESARELGNAVMGMLKSFQAAVPVALEHLKVIARFYRTCDADGNIENIGHDFKTDLKPADKQALKAFMATL